MKTKYPYQIDSIVHKSKTVKKTFSMEAHLASPEEENPLREPAAPLELHEGYSVFKGTLIYKDAENKKFVAFNISPKAVPYIHEKTHMLIAQNMITNSIVQKLKKIILSSAKSTVTLINGFFRNSMQSLFVFFNKAFPKITALKLSEEETDILTDPDESSMTSKAYTITIKSGKLKGKTPAEVLIENSLNMALLENQKKWLEDNIIKYPANQEQIDAINDAIQLYKLKKLTTIETEETETIDTKTYTVYETAYKNVKPLDETGRYTIYQVSVKYMPENNLPFVIEAMNCFAPVDKSKGNEIIMSKAVNKKQVSMALSEEEWCTMIDSMLEQKRLFEIMTYPQQLELAKKINEDNKKESKKTKAV
ncbi:hypothetical protein [Hungatella hathewayi]|uniref:hypothetical protein n=1 Tax=Hungatella hathewayi TaxID=154046 RepID=UPI00356A6847